MLLDHVAIPVSDLDAARRFYEQALQPFGAKVMMEFPGGLMFAGGEGAGMVALRESASVSPIHVALSADREHVRAFYDAAVAAGGRDNGEPGVRPHYHENYYAAFVHDLDGNNIEAVCHQPA
jgi:catechol 2,3-dioxygenase-like lactoylglutathione lyase family enzyme